MLARSRFVPIAIACFVGVPASARAQRLFVATPHDDTIVVAVDGGGGGARSAIKLPTRIMTADQAIARAAAYPPWVEDSTVDVWELQEKRARGETVRAGSWPEALAVGGGSLFAVVGDEEPGFVVEVPLAGGAAPRYFDVLQRHPLAAVAAGDKLFVTYLNHGVWTIDPHAGASAIQRIDGVADGCTLLARGRDDTTVFAAASADDGTPVVLAIDAKRARLARTLRLPRDASERGGETIEAMGVTSDGALWVVTIDGARRALTVHLADAGSGRFRRAAPSWAIAGLRDGRHPSVTVANQTLFALTDAGLEAFALAPPRRAPPIALPDRADGIWAAPDGARIFVALPDERAILPFALARSGGAAAAGVTREPPIVVDGELGAITIEPATR